MVAKFLFPKCCFLLLRRSNASRARCLWIFLLDRTREVREARGMDADTHKSKGRGGGGHLEEGGKIKEFRADGKTKNAARQKYRLSFSKLQIIGYSYV